MFACGHIWTCCKDKNLYTECFKNDIPLENLKNQWITAKDEPGNSIGEDKFWEINNIQYSKKYFTLFWLVFNKKLKEILTLKQISRIQYFYVPIFKITLQNADGIYSDFICFSGL